MKIFLIVLAIAALIAIGYLVYKGGYGKSNQVSNSGSVATNSVNISNFAFSPANITVKAGSVISFRNNDSVSHTITADNNQFDQQVNPGETVTITITNPGTYGYYCSIHTSMKGTIVVQ